MKRTVFLFVCLGLWAVSGYTQNVHYSQLKTGLADNTCNAKPSAGECRQSIRLIEDWMGANPADTMAGAYWDLQVYHYLLAGKDTAGSREHFTSSIFYNLKYCEVAEAGQRHRGYWNAAVCYVLLGDCGNAVKYLRLARTSPGAKKRYRDAGTEKGIKKMCGKRPSG